jgi:Type II secretion system (T2SS), protein G
MNSNLRWVAIPAAVVLLAILTFVAFRNHSRRAPGKITEAPTTTKPVQKPIRPAAGTAAVLRPDPATLQKVPSHPMAVSFGKSPDRAAAEPATLLEILQFYRQEFGSFPAGEDNASIMNALTGNNPSGLPIFPADHPRIAEDGSLRDAWGKPFFFHMISSQHIEVRSLGPDGVIFTDDDILVPKRPDSP